MSRINNLLLLFLSVLLSSCVSQTADERAMRQMAERLFPEHASRFSFVQDADDSCGKDWYEIEAEGRKIVISGNNANSMAVGLNSYLNNYCHTSVSWYLDDKIQMPEELPLPETKVRSEARCENRFFLNYCTFGYTMPWWSWEEWERFIDWMALNGVNLPLAITGQEAVWYRVWSKLGLTDEEIRNYFTGPAHLPWHRMTNLDYWQGPLPMEWLDAQVELQKKIVERERQYNMRPVLPAFAGHVPAELNRVYPEAKISRMSSWGGFKDEYRSHFLDPLDSLFTVIQKEFLEQQTGLFGTDHIYGADPFNEVDPPSWEPEFLATCARNLYGSLTQVDPDATWLQMTWLFYIDRDEWTNERVEAFLRAVPQDRLILLDYYCENTEVWKQTESYYGQPYIWCYLGNFGGNTMLAGNVKEVGERIENVFAQGGDNFSGLGSTLEGFDCNQFMYEYLFAKAWDSGCSDEEWFEKLADRRSGREDKAVREAWKGLYEKIYVDPAILGHATLVNARPSLKGHGNWTTEPKTVYDNEDLFDIWETMLSAEEYERDAYGYDVVNIGRQVLGNHFLVLRDEFASAYEERNVDALVKKGEEMMGLLADVDRLLGTQSSFLLGKWIADARAVGSTEELKDYYEENARNLISTWGDRNQSLNDYANRTWNGMVSDYYAPRWEMFINDVVGAVVEGREFDRKGFHEKVTQFEIDWVKSDRQYISEPEGDSVEIARELMNKYRKSVKKR